MMGVQRGGTEQRMCQANIQQPGDWCTITYYEYDVQVRLTVFEPISTFLGWRNI